MHLLLSVVKIVVKMRRPAVCNSPANDRGAISASDSELLLVLSVFIKRLLPCLISSEYDSVAVPSVFWP